MKRLAWILAVALSVLALTACGVEKVDEANKEPEVLGDLSPEDSPYAPSSYDEEQYITVIEYEGKMTRVTCEMDEKTFNALQDIDYDKDDAIEQENKILSKLKIKKMEDLSDQLLSEEEIEAYIGKKGEDLLNDGFTINGGSAGDEGAVYFLEKGIAEYNVYFKENVAEDVDFYSEEPLKPLTITKIELEGPSYMATETEPVEETDEAGETEGVAE